MPGQFAAKIYDLVNHIPAGQVATYGQLARLAGRPQAARAVGRILCSNPNLLIVPCHRVVGSTGRLCGYTGSGGVSAKYRLLLSEGVQFTGPKVNLNACLWQPLQNCPP